MTFIEVYQDSWIYRYSSDLSPGPSTNPQQEGACMQCLHGAYDP